MKLGRADAKAVECARRNHQEAIIPQEGFDQLLRFGRRILEACLAWRHVDTGRDFLETPFVNKLADMAIDRSGPPREILASIDLTRAQVALEFDQG